MNNIYDIFKKSNQFDEPKKFNSSYNPYNIEYINKVLDGILVSSNNKINKNCRIYIDGSLKNPFESLEILNEIVKKQIENVDWDKLFDGKEFLFFINFAGEFSEDLLNKSKEYFNGYFNEGDHLIEHHIIFGKYSQTSFGIHIDDANDRVIHYNIGQSSKTLFLKDFDSYVSKYGESDMYYDKTVLDGFTKYCIEPGEVFVLPANYYHIGQSPEVSFNIVLALTKINNITRIEEITKRLKNKYLNKNNYDKIRKNFNFNENSDELIKSQDFNSIYKSFIYELISNSSFIEKPKTETNFNFDIISKLKFVFTTKVYYYIENQNYFFYSNGYKCEITPNNFEEINKLLTSEIIDFEKIDLLDDSILSSFCLWLLYTKTIKEVI